MFNVIRSAVSRQLWIRSGLTQAELANCLGVHRMTVARLESGQAQPEAKLQELAHCSDEELTRDCLEPPARPIGARPIRV